jgi:hypothetical protein
LVLSLSFRLELELVDSLNSMMVLEEASLLEFLESVLEFSESVLEFSESLLEFSESI